MDELVKMLDKNLDYLNHEVEKDTMKIHVASNREVVTCPYCHAKTTKVHSTYSKSFQDLPMPCKKVLLLLENRKMFCHNADCSKKTFAERFDFLDFKSKKTNRLITHIQETALHCSSVATSTTLKRNVVDISHTTVLNLFKKR